MKKQYTLLIKIIITILTIIPLLLTGCTQKPITEEEILLQGQILISGININKQSIFSTPSNTGVYQGTELAGTDTLSDINITPLHIANFIPDEYIIKLTKELSEEYINREILNNRGQVIRNISPGVYKIKLTNPDDELIEKLTNDSTISYIEPDYLVHIQATPDDPAFFQQWNLSMLNLSQTWENYKGNKSVTVAVIDTGILFDHPDLRDNIVPGYDFIDNDDYPLDTDPDFSHGTHVAGIIGAMTNNSIGIAGINWDIQIMPVRVIGPGGTGGYSTLVAGINWAVDNGANIINLSLAGPVDSAVLREAIQNAINNGVTVVAAAGNNGTTPLLYPANYPEVISVGAIGPTKKRAYYSNYGPNLDLVAPGGDNSIFTQKYNMILSTSGYMGTAAPVYKYTWAQGTSMAAPHVTGLIALLYSAGMTEPAFIQEHLKKTADDLGPAGPDNEYGAGLININRALTISNNGNNDSYQLLEKVKILAMPEEIDSNTQTLSVSPDPNGSFSLKIKPGRWTITGWIDVDNNNELNSGDYYGELENKEYSESGYISIYLERYQ